MHLCSGYHFAVISNNMLTLCQPVNVTSVWVLIWKSQENGVYTNTYLLHTLLSVIIIYEPCRLYSWSELFKYLLWTFFMSLISRKSLKLLFRHTVLKYKSRNLTGHFIVQIMSSKMINEYINLLRTYFNKSIDVTLIILWPLIIPPKEVGKVS